MDNPPAWVADAVLYQIFPDRFARSGRVPAPGPLRLRHETPALRSIEMECLAAEGMACAYRRGTDPGSVVVAINAGETDARLPLPDGLTELFATSPAPDVGTIPARSGRLFRAS